MKKTMHLYKQFKGIVFFGLLDIKRKLRIITGKKLYYVIGDSHTLCFQHECFEIHHLGPATAYKLNFNKSTTRGREKVLKILRKIYKGKSINVVFVFGELDTRIHINKISNEKKLTVNKVIDETIKSYLSFLNFIKEKYPFIDIYVFNILPQGEEENIYNFPYYASREKRSMIAREMNKKLKKEVFKNKFKFIYIYDNLIHKNGERIRKFVFDDVHFNRKIMPFVLSSLNKISEEK